MMVGLQGSGKTTTSAKLARLLRLRERKKVLLASLDVQRPAAQEQLAVLARQVEVDLAADPSPASARWRSRNARSMSASARATTW